MAIALILGSDGFLAQVPSGVALQADAFERKSASGNLVVGALLATEELQLGSTTALVHALGDAEIDGYIEIIDTTAPGNAGAGRGRVYKKTGNDGLFWIPDAAGAEVDLTEREAPIAAGTSPQFFGWDKTWRVPAWPTGYVDGLALGRVSASQLSIAAGCCRSSDDTANLANTGSITVAITSSGANGLDTGSEASSTWYYVYLIYNPGTSTYAGLLSLSSTAPTMPSGYTLKRRVGSWYNDSSSNLRAATMVLAAGNMRWYEYDGETSATVRVLNGGNSTSFASLSCASFIPPTSTYGLFLVEMQGMSSSGYCYIRRNGSSVATPIYQQYGGFGSLITQAVSSSAMWIKTDASQVIQYLVYSAFANATIWVNGYRETI